MWVPKLVGIGIFFPISNVLHKVMSRLYFKGIQKQRGDVFPYLLHVQTHTHTSSHAPYYCNWATLLKCLNTLYWIMIVNYLLIFPVLPTLVSTSYLLLVIASHISYLHFSGLAAFFFTYNPFSHHSSHLQSSLYFSLIHISYISHL